MNFKYIHYCPICGFSLLLEGATICQKCKNQIEAVQSLYEYEYYERESLKKYGTTKQWKDVLMKEIVQNPLYNSKPPAKAEETSRSKIPIADYAKPSQNLPKCPTCGSTNLEKISDLKRGAHAIAFGIFSKTAFSQYRCKNCGYKW